MSLMPPALRAGWSGFILLTQAGSVREFASTSWMSFGDYQHNYRDLHDRLLPSRHLRGPVVNSEYGCRLRDQNGDRKPDKSNSDSTEDMRFGRGCQEE